MIRDRYGTVALRHESFPIRLQHEPDTPHCEHHRLDLSLAERMRVEDERFTGSHADPQNERDEQDKDESVTDRGSEGEPWDWWEIVHRYSEPV